MDFISKDLLEAYIDSWNECNIFGKLVFNIILLPIWLLAFVVWFWLDILVLIFICEDKIFKRNQYSDRIDRYMGDEWRYISEQEDKMPLDPKYQFLNDQAEWERKKDEMDYKNKCVDAIINAQREIWEYQKEKVEDMSYDDKLSWLPKWAEYLAKHELRTDYDKDSLAYIKMPFDFFIAANIDPDWYIIIQLKHLPMKITKGYIEYIK